MLLVNEGNARWRAAFSRFSPGMPTTRSVQAPSGTRGAFPAGNLTSSTGGASSSAPRCAQIIPRQDMKKPSKGKNNYQEIQRRSEGVSSEHGDATNYKGDRTAQEEETGNEKSGTSDGLSFRHSLLHLSAVAGSGREAARFDHRGLSARVRSAGICGLFYRQPYALARHGSRRAYQSSTRRARNVIQRFAAPTGPASSS